MHMWQWMDYTPQFQLMVVLISSPLSLMVALWGMTSNKLLKMMRDCSTSDGLANNGT
jgi:hypothetical protein